MKEKVTRDYAYQLKKNHSENADVNKPKQIIIRNAKGEAMSIRHERLKENERAK